MTTVTPGGVAPAHHHRFAWAAGLVALALVLTVAGLVALSALKDDGPTTSSTTLTGSGTPAQETRAVPAFAAVELVAANEVNVRVGSKQSVVVLGDDNVLPHVTTEVEDGTLVIGADRSFETKTPLTVAVTVPALTAAALSGSGRVTVDGVRAERFEATLLGSGALTVNGTAETLDAELSGTGQLTLYDLVAANVKAVVSGAGQLSVNATSSLDAAVSGAGQIVYTGSPEHVTQDVTGAGTVTPG
jgi:hypothetical protein